MTMLRLRHVDRFRDRHGRVRYYFRRGKGPRIPLPGLPGSDAFMVAYRAALGGTESQPKPTNYANRGTFNHLALEYFSSPDFLRLRPQTRHVYRLVIERFLKDHGHRLVREMIRDDVKRIVASKADTPGAANDLLKKIRALIRFAIESGIRRMTQHFASRHFLKVKFIRGPKMKLCNLRRAGRRAQDSEPHSRYFSTPDNGAPT
jgi:enterobacteria phage integrase